MIPLTERLLEIVWHIENDLTLEGKSQEQMSFPTRDEAVEAIMEAFRADGWSKQ